MSDYLEDIAIRLWTEHGRHEAHTWGELPDDIRAVWRRRAVIHEDVRRQLEPEEVTIATLRSELSALRQRAEAVEARAGDLALLARYVWRKHKGNVDLMSMKQRPPFWSLVADGTRIEGEDDGTGLPLLTDSARAALRAATAEALVGMPNSMCGLIHHGYAEVASVKDGEPSFRLTEKGRNADPRAATEAT